MDCLTTRIKTAAIQAGFSRAQVCSADAEPEIGRFHSWLDAGYAGQMNYLENRRPAYSDPALVLEGVRSIVMLTTDYAIDDDRATSDIDVDRASVGAGLVARYAKGERDYHDVIHKRLKSLKQFVLSESPGAVVRGVVDTAPLLERDYARLAGLGWIGKNTMLIHRDDGSWFFLAALLTDLELKADPPFATDHCGACRACLDACPTDAFPQPYVLDAQRCISYLTIELRGDVPVDLREGMGDWVFGCDVCQDICPWNRRHTTTIDKELQLRGDLNPLELRSLFELTDDDFRARFRRTPLWRSKREGILRNAAIVLGNQAAEASVSALTVGAADQSAVIRAASAWALGRVGSPIAISVLQERLQVERDDTVRTEIDLALRG
jgi:epoxyqueuosine reductase